MSIQLPDTDFVEIDVDDRQFGVESLENLDFLQLRPTAICEIHCESCSSDDFENLSRFAIPCQIDETDEVIPVDEFRKNLVLTNISDNLSRMVTTTFVRSVLDIGTLPTKRTDGQKPSFYCLGKSRKLLFDSVVCLTSAMITDHFCHHFENDGKSSRHKWFEEVSAARFFKST